MHWSFFPILSTLVSARHTPEVGKLPALGWNSWNAFHCDIDEGKFISAAETLISRGFTAAGYQYVNIDDCWSMKDGRDNETHQLLPNTTRFPDGIKGTADKIHAMGLSFGIYSSAGTKTCADYPASIGFESIDAETFASWGVDYLKYDNCNVPSNWTDMCVSCSPDYTDSSLANGTCIDKKGLCPDGYDFSMSNTADRYTIMGDALKNQNRTILYSLCEWGMDEVWTWGQKIAQSWRTTGDIDPSWSRIMDILNQNSFLSNYGDFYGHNDPDMLEVGNGNLTTQESRSHFALWAMLKSPLIIGTDLAKLSQANVDILTNKHLLAFNQDNLVGRSASPYKWGTNDNWTYNATNPAEFWAGHSSKGVMVAMLNTLEEMRHMRADFSEVPGLRQGGEYNVLNVWSGEDMGCVKHGVDMSVESHDTAVLLLQDSCGCRI